MGTNGTYKHEELSLLFWSSSGTHCSIRVADLPKDLQPAGVPLETILLGLKDKDTFYFNFQGGNREFAIITSVRGINPLTGFPAEDELHAHGRGGSLAHGILSMASLSKEGCVKDARFTGPHSIL